MREGREKSALRLVRAALAVAATGLALACWDSREASAQARPPLKLRVQPASMNNRSGGPIPVELTFDWSGSTVLQGKLEATFGEGAQTVARYQGPDMALAAGEQRFWMLFPGVSASYPGQQMEVSLAFRTATGVLDLGTCPLLVPSPMQRWLSIGVSDPREGRDGSTSAIAQSLKLDRFVRTTDEGTGRVFSCAPVHVEPENLPLYPLGYCCYDVVLLKGRAFELLREKQLKALRRWVEAGGSVCVIPQGGLRSYHVDFLNGLCEAKSAKFQLTPDGDLDVTEGPGGGGLLCVRSGLGRTVVVTDFEQRLLDSDRWREAVCFLWKTRLAVQKEIGRTGRFNIDMSETYGGRQFQTTGQFLRGLLPPTARLIPLWLIALLLAVFVLAVGPGDYFLLGLVKLRRLTWVLFPVWSVALTLFLVYLSGQYLGRSDRSRSITFVDVGRAGRVLRTNRYELLFAARSQQTVTECRDCFFAPVNLEMMDLGGYGGPYYSVQEKGSPCYAGRIPSRYSAWQEIRKWTPQLNRIFSIASDVAETDEASGEAATPGGDARHPALATNESRWGTPPRLNWDAIDVRLLESEAGRQSIKEKLVGKGAFDGNIHVMHLGQRYSPYRVTPEFSEEADYRGGPPRMEVNYRGSIARMEDTYPPMAWGLEPFIHEACVGPSKGLLSLVSQISPTASAGFDDLAVHDATDPGQWLVTVVTRSGNDTVVCRRLYTGED